MSNHVYHHLTARGPQASLQALAALFTDGAPDCERLIPEPELAEEYARAYPGYLYDWRNEHWGCTSGCYDGSLSIKEGVLTATFSTAWRPAIPAVQELIRRYPELSVRVSFLDEGGGFAGILHGRGEVMDVPVDPDSPYFRAVHEDIYGELPLGISA